MSQLNQDLRFMQFALDEAHIGHLEGGIPIGSVLVLDNKVIGRGHNRRMQNGNPVLHGEMDCLQNAGRLTAQEYKKCTLYTTLSPCDMCSGAILLYKIPRVVMAENTTFKGSEELLKSRGVDLINLNLRAAIQMMQEYIQKNPQVWNEDIGV